MADRGHHHHRAPPFFNAPPPPPRQQFPPPSRQQFPPPPPQQFPPPPLQPHLNSFMQTPNLLPHEFYMQQSPSNLFTQTPPFYSNFLTPQKPTNPLPQFPKPISSISPKLTPNLPPVSCSDRSEPVAKIDQCPTTDRDHPKPHAPVVYKVKAGGGGGSSSSSETVAKIEAVVESVKTELVVAGEYVSGWKVSKLVLVKLKAESWESLGIQCRDVRSFLNIMMDETKNVKGSVESFITTWKEACQKYTGDELFGAILNYHQIKRGTRPDLTSIFPTTPLSGLLNVAVITILRGMWNSSSNTFSFSTELGQDVDDSTRIFVRAWKEVLHDHSAGECIGKMLDSCGLENKIRNRLRSLISTYPLSNFLDVVVKSIKSGIWDSFCVAIQSRNEPGKLHVQADELTRYKSINVELIERNSIDPSNGKSCHTDVSFCIGAPAIDDSEKDKFCVQSKQSLNEQGAALVIESIRREDFGLDPNISSVEYSMLKKQHARTGRALHFLSQELYSQNTHFLLELVQNADDNVYLENVEPALTFILQKTSVLVLNNERGFTAENMRALCDIGSSTKKNSSAGYIGHKGIGFKSVFQITDAPEIHSNGFHVKFDAGESEIGVVLPTVVPPHDIDMLSGLVSEGDIAMGMNCWNTRIILPLKRISPEGSDVRRISSMFCDIHPSLLLFLRRLKCIELRNMLKDSHVVIRKEIIGDGIVKLSRGDEETTWFVTSKVLPVVDSANHRATELSIAAKLFETVNSDYESFLHPQPVFAFLPLRSYGLKFILHAEFDLPSSKEDIDGDSPWNQWLLSEFPEFFVSIEKAFCSLPCFRENVAKAVSAYMSIVPLMGEVHGFFSHLPRMIISKLCESNCLLADGSTDEWVPPCKVMRGWNEQVQMLFPGVLLFKYLGLKFLHKNICLSDRLATALGIEEYGPRTLVQFVTSLSHNKDGIKSMGLSWLFLWLNELYSLFQSSALDLKSELDLIDSLKKVPLIPLSNGTYVSSDEGSVWLWDIIRPGICDDLHKEAFSKLYATLRTVSPDLFSGSTDVASIINCTRMLQKIGAQPISAHELIRNHILPSISDDCLIEYDERLMTEYVTFVMVHLQSNCSLCQVEEEFIISELCCKALILTNHGYKRPIEVPIHFSVEFGNPVDSSRFLQGLEYKWYEVKTIYLKHPVTKSLSCGLTKWREFFQKLGVTDLVKVVPSEKSIAVLSSPVFKQMMCDRHLICPPLVVKDWESPELVQILYLMSKDGNPERCKYFLQFLDALWDESFSDKVVGFCNSVASTTKLSFESSLLTCISDVKWVASSVDNELHYPRELFHDCDSVRSILGCHIPYAVPKIKSIKLLNSIGFKTQVTLDHVLAILQTWRSLKSPFTASLSQMRKLYTFIWKEMANSRQQVVDILSSVPFIFFPTAAVKLQDDVVPGVLLSAEELYWDDSTGAVELIKDSDLPITVNSIFFNAKKQQQLQSVKSTSIHLCKTLCSLYPSLHDFFVPECGVNEAPSPHQYLHILRRLSKNNLPSVAAKSVFQVLMRWSDGLKCGTLSPDEITYLRESILQLDNMVLPTMQENWVSTHPSFGLVCWCDDDNLEQEFDYSQSIIFLNFGELTDSETEILHSKGAVLFQHLGIPSLSEIVSREAIFYQLANPGVKISMVEWVLPFAQLYLYNIHPESYKQLKLSGFNDLRQLRIVVVNKLFYRYVIKRCECSSKKQSECGALLEGNILFTTEVSDFHSLFMELSRLLFDGTADLHLANFLHMITLMRQAGSPIEQIELFILSSQNMSKLPDEESVWSLSPPFSLLSDDELLLASPSLTNISESISSKCKKKTTFSTPPPKIWKPKTGTKILDVTRDQTGNSGSSNHISANVVQENTDAAFPEVEDDPNIVDDDDMIEPPSSTILSLFKKKIHNVCDLHQSGMEVELLDSFTDIVGESICPQGQSLCIEKNQQQLQTGRQGEFVAFKYFAEKESEQIVNWVNQEKETGLPYDLVLGEGDSREYIEVKATRNAKKNWFNITKQEWQFAIEKGNSFSIAHIILSGENLSRLVVYKNPVKLCQNGEMMLVPLSPKCQYLRPKTIVPLNSCD